MAMKRYWLLGLIAVGFTGAALAGIRSYTTRPCCRCGIPARDYQYRPRSRSAMATSRPPLFMPDKANAKKIKRFQFTPTKLTVDHCSISSIELQIHSNGVWVLSLDADQNPQTDDGQPGPAVTPDGLHTAHLKRNEFVVAARCYGASAGSEVPAAATAGKPVLLTLEPAEFWVQQGHTRHYWKKATSTATRIYAS